MILSIINIVLTIVVLLALYFTYKLPGYILDRLLEKYKTSNARSIQVESYFKQIGGKKQQELFSEWTDFLTDLTNTTAKYSASSPEGVEKYRKLMHETIIYASDNTLRLFSGYSVCQYKGDKEEKSLIYIACIVSSLKQDFSGYKIDPLSLLKIVINDYEDNRDKFEKIEREIEEEIKEL